MNVIDMNGVEEEEKGYQFEDIPPELLIHTFEFLTFRECHGILRVCTSWYLLLIPLAQKQYYDRFSKMTSKSWSLHKRREGKWWEWSPPSDCERYDGSRGRDIHRQMQEADINFTVCELPKMSKRGFSQFKKLNDMKIIKGANRRFQVSKPYVILSELEFPLPPLDRGCEVEYDFFYPEFNDEEWEELKLFLLSLNSLKRRAIERELKTAHCSMEYELYFLMRDETVWHLYLKIVFSEKRYTDFNE